MTDQVKCTRRGQPGKPPLELSARACGLSWLAAKSGNPTALATSVADCVGCETGERNAAGLTAPETVRAKRISGYKAQARNRAERNETDPPPAARATEEKVTAKKEKTYSCACGKTYDCSSALWYHKKRCDGAPADPAANPAKRTWSRRPKTPAAPAGDLGLMTFILNESATVGELLAAAPELRAPIIAALRGKT